MTERLIIGFYLSERMRWNDWSGTQLLIFLFAICYFDMLE